MSTAAAGAAHAAAMLAQAIKAMGAIVEVEPDVFVTIVERSEKPLVIAAGPGGIFDRKLEYLTAYGGFVFYTKSDEPILLPGKAELIGAKSIWVPG